MAHATLKPLLRDPAFSYGVISTDAQNRKGGPVTSEIIGDIK